jgi:hypothetical protein
MGITEWELETCPIDECVNIICGGPHEEIFTDLGWEVVRLGQHPMGSRITPTADDELTRWSVLHKGQIGD